VDAHEASRPVASTPAFCSRRWLRSDRWHLVDSHLECQSSFLGIVLRRRRFSLSALRYSLHVHIQPNGWLLPACLSLAMFAVSWGWCILRLPLPAAVQPFIWLEKSRLLTCITGGVVLLLAGFPRCAISVDGSPPLFIEFAWWERKQARAFADKIGRLVDSGLQ